MSNGNTESSTPVPSRFVRNNESSRAVSVSPKNRDNSSAVSHSNTNKTSDINDEHAAATTSYTVEKDSIDSFVTGGTKAVITDNSDYPGNVDDPTHTIIVKATITGETDCNNDVGCSEGNKTNSVASSEASSEASEANTVNAVSTDNVTAVDNYTDSLHSENSPGDQVNFFRSRELDRLIQIHEDLCDIVHDTVSAYSVWFVLHWITYGLTGIVIVIFFSEEISNKSKYRVPAESFVFYGLQMATNIYLFVMPCCCAAFITNTCGGRCIIIF